MTTDQIIDFILRGIPLIKESITQSLMLHNSGFSFGQVSLAYRMGVISGDDFSNLNDEIQKAKDYWMEKSK